jgi:hypothetical protein
LLCSDDKLETVLLDHTKEPTRGAAGLHSSSFPPLDSAGADIEAVSERQSADAVPLAELPDRGR